MVFNLYFIHFATCCNACLHPGPEDVADVAEVHDVHGGPGAVHGDLELGNVLAELSTSFSFNSRPYVVVQHEQVPQDQQHCPGQALTIDHTISKLWIMMKLNIRLQNCDINLNLMGLMMKFDTSML